ncbi:MAG: AAA family ATPase [Candidatus Aenigmatarchaeota archaeon]
MNKLVAIVGMPGSGKSEAARIFEKHSFVKIRFGDVTDEFVKKKGLLLNEENERAAREALRKKCGMDAYAKLNDKRIDDALKKSDVVIDGMYSLEEYMYLKKKYPNISVVAINAAPELRYKRLAARAIRPLTQNEAKTRDMAEIMNTNKEKTIANADFKVMNDGSINELRESVKKIINVI